MKLKYVFLSFIPALFMASCQEEELIQTVATPTAIPEAGTYTQIQTVTLLCDTEGAGIYYTVDGNEPSVNSTLFINPFQIDETATVKAFAVKNGMTNSGIFEAAYIINLPPETYTVTAGANPAAGGTVTRSPDQQDYDAGTEVTVTATADSGYIFTGWTGAPLGVNASSASITFNIIDDVTLTAGFQEVGTMPIERSRLNVDYAPEGSRRHTRQRYDLRLPDTGEGPFPLLIYVHGGGFFGGNWQLTGNNNGLVSLARSRGYAVASVGYLLMGQSGWSGGQRAFPENVEDILAAVRHLRANAAEYRLDPSRFAISGFSAGGYLTAIVCALSGATDHGYDVTGLGNAGVSHAVQAAASSAALTDFALLDTHQSQNPGINYQMTHDSFPEGAMLGGNLKDNTDSMKNYLWMQNPLTHISAVTPPIYMLHGTSDNLVPWQQSEMMVNKVNEFVPGKAVFNKVTGRDHADFDGAANATTIAILNFLDEALGIQR